ncbi:hypothetical protein V8E36_009383 [Tilletia maclaganii]
MAMCDAASGMRCRPGASRRTATPSSTSSSSTAHSQHSRDDEQDRDEHEQQQHHLAGFHMRITGRRRGRSRCSDNHTSAFTSSIASSLLLLILTLSASPTLAQRTSSSSSSSTTAAPSSTSPAAISPTATAATLSEFLPVRLNLASTSASGIFFRFPIPANTTTTTDTAPDGTTTTLRAAPTRLSVSISVCGGPSVQPYDVNNSTLVRSLSSRNSAEEVRQLTLLRAYWTDSDDALSAGGSTNGDAVDPSLVADANAPGPNAQDGNGIQQTHITGGASLIQLRIDRDADKVFTLGVWPPQDLRDVSNGTWSVRVTASIYVAPESVSLYEGVSLDDTDWSSAIVTSRMLPNTSVTNTSQHLSPNVSVYVLPSDGPVALNQYFNSSLCALEEAFAAFNSSGIVYFNTSETSRGMTNLRIGGPFTKGGIDANALNSISRVQIKIVELSPATNYTVWMRYTQPQFPRVPLGVMDSILYPAIKMLTKSSPNCRLVSDLDFCPSVAYSIPIAPGIETAVAIAAANLTITPNMANFTRMINTFPCGDPYFGSYSVVSTCEDCKNAYRDWLCAVVLPRCTDPIAPELSAASQLGTELTGAPTGTNTRLLPYIVNRNVEGSNNGTTPSRRPYIDKLLRPGTYGELLPCIYTCHFVSRACPPINGWSWTCPQWDISAQRDYGTFVDAGVDGVGADLNGGDGLDDGSGGGNSSAPQAGFGPGNSGGGNWSVAVGGADDFPGPGQSSSSSSKGNSTASGGGSASGGSGGSSGDGGGGGLFSSSGDALARGAGQRWGGISRYVATDAFGNQYCNALGLDLVLRQQNGGLRRAMAPRLALLGGLVGVVMGWMLL